MIDKITGITDYFKKVPITFLIAFICVIGLLLFLPENIAETLSINEFREKYRIYLGPSFILTVAFLLARFILFFISIFLEKNVASKLKKENFKRLKQLTTAEKSYLIQYLRDNKNSLDVNINDGVMAGLVAQGITYRATNIADFGDLVFAFNLQPWARELLKENPSLLDN